MTAHATSAAPPQQQATVTGVPVTRFDITEFIGDVFVHGPAHRARLATTAWCRGARPAVVLTLRRLPDHPYRSLTDVWREVPAMPDVYDPWEDCG